jgi:hypothetical protein
VAGDKNWQPFANLNMEGSFNVAEDELDTMNLGLLKQLLGLSSLKFEMPQFSFKGFKINHPDLPLGQMLGFDKLDIFGDLKLGGLSINFLGIDFEDKEIMVEGKPKKAKGCVFRLSKGFDFDFKIWSTRNSEDSTKWDFAKFNFDFGLPKIECTTVPPIEVTQQTPAALAVNQIVKVGSFAMKVGQLATETTKGFGTIRIPYLGSDIKVEFGKDLQINGSSEAFSGGIFSVLNPLVAPLNAVTEKANGLREIAVNALDINGLTDHLKNTASNELQLPISMKRLAGKFGQQLPFDLLLTQMNFRTRVPSMSLAMLVPTGLGQYLRFEVPSIGMHSKGFDLSDMKLQ